MSRFEFCVNLGLAGLFLAKRLEMIKCQWIANLAKFAPKDSEFTNKIIYKKPFSLNLLFNPREVAVF